MESHHAALKRHLASSMGNFKTCWARIHTLMETSHNAIKSGFEKSANVVHHKFKSPIFKELRGMVSIAALDKIHEAMECMGEGGVDPLLCGCVLRKTCGLPCAHEISEYVRLGKAIPVGSVDSFWRKLDMNPIVVGDADVGVGNDFENRCNDCLVDIKTKFSQSTETERLLILKRLREVLNPTTTSLIEPEIPIRTRGRSRPAKAKQSKSTKRDPSAFEYVESVNDSCSPKKGVIYDVGQSDVPPPFITMTRQKILVNLIIIYLFSNI